MSIPRLIVGGTRESRRVQFDLSPNPDLLLLEPEKSVTIKDIRTLQKFLSRKPYQKEIKTAVIDQAETLTLPAQQALLKTLEEPPAHSQIILLCPSENNLIDTIVSRCQIQKIKDTAPDEKLLTEHKIIYEKIARGKTLERFAIMSAYNTNNSTAREFVLNQLKFMRGELIVHPETVNIKLIRTLEKSLAALQVNVNPKLTLDVLSLGY